MSGSVYERFPFIWPYNARPGEVMRGGPDVSFGEVWNILASLVVRRRRLRQASGCRSFVLSPSILGNDSVLYRNLSNIAHHVPEADVGPLRFRSLASTGVYTHWTMFPN